MVCRRFTQAMLRTRQPSVVGVDVEFLCIRTVISGQVLPVDGARSVIAIAEDVEVPFGRVGRTFPRLVRIDDFQVR